MIVRCQGCGKEFFRRDSEAVKTQTHFCSRACRVTRVEVPCETCGKPVTRKPSELAAFSHVYCSHACRSAQVQVECETCGKIFYRTPDQVRRAKHQYCSTSCHYGRENNILTPEGKSRIGVYACEVCEKPFERSISHAARALHIFCSHGCHGIWERGKNNPAYQGGMVECVCHSCGKIFSRKRSEVNRTMYQYCSPECYTTLSRGPNHPRYQALFDTCGWCNQIIQIKGNQVGQRNFCSRPCANAAHSEYISGTNNPRYIDGGGTSRYSKEFRDVAILVRNRHGHQCVLCQRSRIENGQELDVHHINYDKQDNRPGNLVALCRWCHGKMHGSPEQRHQWKEFWLDVLSQFPPQSMFTISA